LSSLRPPAPLRALHSTTFQFSLNVRRLFAKAKLNIDFSLYALVKQYQLNDEGSRAITEATDN